MTQALSQVPVADLDLLAYYVANFTGKNAGGRSAGNGVPERWRQQLVDAHVSRTQHEIRRATCQAIRSIRPGRRSF